MKKIELRKEPRIYYTDWIIPPFRGMTIPPFGIFIKKEFKGNEDILLHDRIHWSQYERMGLFMFYLRYFVQLVFIGYDTMPMEMEARRFEEAEDKWNYRKVYHDKESTSGKTSTKRNVDGKTSETKRIYFVDGTHLDAHVEIIWKIRAGLGRGCPPWVTFTREDDNGLGIMINLNNIKFIK